MATKKRLKLDLHEGCVAKLVTMAASIGLPVEVYVEALVLRHVVTGDETIAAKRGPGRPMTVLPDDIPEGIERSATPSGFSGVTRRGRFWAAKLEGEYLGQFSTPDLAAVVRHYTLKGFQVGRGAYFREVGGLSPEAAAQVMSTTRYSTLPTRTSIESLTGGMAPALPVPSQHQRVSWTPNTICTWCEETFEPDEITLRVNGKLRHTECADLIRDDDPDPTQDPSDEGRSSEEPGEAQRRGTLTPSTLMEILAPNDVNRQDGLPPDIDPKIRQLFAPDPNKCHVCLSRLTGAQRQNPTLCVACNRDYAVWIKLPATGASTATVPADGVYVSGSKGAAKSESFADYVRWVRSL